MPAPLTLYLVRHGEVHNPNNILYGRLPHFELSTTGLGQASAAAKTLSSQRLNAIYSSPLERAKQTANIIATAQSIPLEVQVDERLNESHTPHEGRPHSELSRENYEIYKGNQPPYEVFSDIRRRLLHFIHEMRHKHPHEHIAAVSHGDVVVSAFLFVKQHPIEDTGRNQLFKLGLPEHYPVTASISTLIYHTDHADEIPEYRYQRPY